MAPKNSKLFHLLVVLGASMTAGAIEACSSGGPGTVDPQAQKDAAADGEIDYQKISYKAGDAAGDVRGNDVYQNISPYIPDASGSDVYVTIGYQADAYPHISPPPQGDI
jgi:hypothetical protein